MFLSFEVAVPLHPSKRSLEQYLETRRHSAIVLEKYLDSQLTQFCKDKEITVETFL
ncbi:hypothetical protein RIVM261_041020 [Rivularia sp. IAM M-261]|nr:hypothetical protein RIVM261_041020 [Rivularia sp. IAM M-261]